MGLFSILNGKKKEKTQPEPEEKSPNRLSDPGQPKIDLHEFVGSVFWKFLFFRNIIMFP